jgi:hypothetical protein
MVKQIWYDLDNPEEAKIAKEVSLFSRLIKSKTFICSSGPMIQELISMNLIRL